ncbi:cation:proton antiporter [Gemmatimonadota bacterium]
MEHFVLLFGTLLVAATILAILLRPLRQSLLIAFVLTGLIAGAFRDSVHLPHELLEVFTEIGIILLLFMAGLEMDFPSLRKRWKLVLSHGLGQIFIMAALGAVLGAWLLGMRGFAAPIFFGLALTFSSTIVVLGVLKTRRELESFHGQVVLGIMVLQDITAVMALVVLDALSGGEGSLGLQLGMVLLKLCGLFFVLALLSKAALPRLFRYLADSRDLLFIGSLGWALGVAAACEALHFSPEIGAFMAGGALSFLPYRLEIQDKVEPMKDFGIILFFIALGYELQIGRDSLGLAVPILAVVGFVVVGTPLLMLCIGYLTRVKSRPEFFVGAIINQISEFSLILATLCHQAGIFDDDAFLVVSLGMLAALIISGAGHQFLEPLYALIQKPLKLLDIRASGIDIPEEFELSGHVVVIGFNEIAERVLDYFRDTPKQVVLVTVDPDVVAGFPPAPHGFFSAYADPYDPDTWEELGFSDAALVVSCMIDGQEAEVGILRWLKRQGSTAPFVAATDSYSDAFELYEAGAIFVMQTDDLAADFFHSLLSSWDGEEDTLRRKGKDHHRSVRERIAAAGPTQ